MFPGQAFVDRYQFMSNPKFLCSPCFATNIAALAAASNGVLSLLLSQGSFGDRYGSVMMASMRAFVKFPVWELCMRSYGGTDNSARSIVASFGAGFAADLSSRVLLLPAAALFQQRERLDWTWARSQVKLSRMAGVQLGLFYSLSQGEKLSTDWTSAAKCFATSLLAGCVGAIPLAPPSGANVRPVVKHALLFALTMTLYERGKLLVGIPTIAMTKWNN